MAFQGEFNADPTGEDVIPGILDLIQEGRPAIGGLTNTVSDSDRVQQDIITDSQHADRVVIIDVHGEYDFKILGEE